jgi:thioredoxin 2
LAADAAICDDAWVMTIACRSCSAKNRVVTSRIEGGETAAVCGKCQAPLLPLDRPVDVESEADFQDLLAHAGRPVLVDFWAGWCGPCVMVAPEVKRLAGLLQGSVVVAKVDTEALPALSQRHGVQGIPCFLLFEDGQVAARSVGARPAEGIAQDLGLAIGQVH